MAMNVGNLKPSSKIEIQTEGLTRRQKEWLGHFDKAVHEYLLNAETNNVSATTLQNYKWRLNYFRVYMVDKEGCADITPDKIYGFRTWLLERKLSISTVRQYLKEVLAFLDWCTWEEHKFYDVTIPAHIIPKKRKQPYGKLLSAEDITKLINARHLKSGKIVTEPQYLRRRAIALIMLTMGLRVSEVCGLNAQDIDLEKGTLFVAHGKGDKQRLLNIPRFAYDALQMYMEEGDHPDFRADGTQALFGTWHEGSWRRLIRQHMAQLVESYGSEQIGRKINPHLLRHAAASFTYLNGASLEEVRQFLGHSEQSTTRIYLQKMFQAVSAPGIENIWNRLEHDAEQETREMEEQTGVKVRRINVVEREYVMIATNDEGEEFELNVTAESEDSAKLKARVYCNREGLKLKEKVDGTIRIRVREGEKK